MKRKKVCARSGMKAIMYGAQRNVMVMGNCGMGGWKAGSGTFLFHQKHASE
jgi:hypothetical protein